MEIIDSVIKLVVVLAVLFAPYVVINALSVIVNGFIKVFYPAYQATQSANEKARQNMENIK